MKNSQTQTTFSLMDSVRFFSRDSEVPLVRLLARLHQRMLMINAGPL